MPPAIRNDVDRWLMVLAVLIVEECEAERYEWAAFWRDEARYLYGEG